MSRFKNATGELTKYALACGYVQSVDIGDYYVKLYMEHEHFHVMMGVSGLPYLHWDTFDAGELTKARKHFRDMVRQAKRLTKWEQQKRV